MSNLEIVFKEISKNKIKLAASPNGATLKKTSNNILENMVLMKLVKILWMMN